MGQITYRDLNEWIDIQAEQETARETFDKQQRRKRDLNAWLIVLLPWSQFVTFAVFYLLSAPHTVYLVERITPGWGKLAPVGFELGVIFVAAMRQKGWRNVLTFAILYALMAVSVIINVGGGFIAVVQSASGQDMARLTLPEIVSRFGSLPAEYQILFPLVVIIGILVPVMGKFSGEAMIKIAAGDIKLESVSIDDLWIKEQSNYVKSALMHAAIKKGAGARTAGAWSQRIVEQLYQEDEFISGHNSVPAVRTVPEVQPEMGFASMLSAQKDNENTQDMGRRAVVLRASRAAEWVDANADFIHAAIEKGGRARDIARAISAEITGNESGYKTVERVLQAKGYKI